MRRRNKPPKKGLGLENQGYTKWYENEKLKREIIEKERHQDAINDFYTARKCPSEEEPTPSVR